MALEVLKVMILVIVLIVFSRKNISHEVDAKRIISKVEDLELERQLRILNKPSVKTIKTEYGDIYDCVDIYKQPAFDHPLLKDHKIQFAGIHTPTDGTTIFRGAAAYMSTYKLSITEDQFSSAMISIESSGTKTDRDYIQFGWTVYPKLYGDSQTRLFTSWTKDNNVQTGCYNILCPGFILLNSNIPLDLVLNTSVPDREIQEYYLVVYQDKINGSWWLAYKEDPEDIIGYWPKELFNDLNNGAVNVRWGGQVYYIGFPSPPMGSGVYKDELWKKTSYFRRVGLVDESYTLVSAEKGPALELSTQRCYLAGSDSYKDDYMGFTFFFGGTGGDNYSCSFLSREPPFEAHGENII